MYAFSFLIASVALAIVNSELGIITSITDKGDHYLMCEQEPIELGIVLDSSSSIRRSDFQRGKDFLVQFLNQFDIGPGEKEVRVSIITFGRGIYPEVGFDLDTYLNKTELLVAVQNIPHLAGTYTDTGLGIQYMHNAQMAPGIVRPYAEKVGLVITDGNSQLTQFTKEESASARADNITMFALGIGSKWQVKQSELENIAGNVDRVTRVENYRSLSSVKQLLAKKTCIKKKKPKPKTTTMAPLQIQSCGENNPADVNFVFSPVDLGIDAVAWSTSFISHTVDVEDMQKGFQYGLVAGDCPDDEGFALNAYQNVDSIKKRLMGYDKHRLPALAQNLIDDGYSTSNGGRDGARKVAVLFVKGHEGLEKGDLESKIEVLKNNSVEVFIANAAGYPITIGGAEPLQGRSSRQQAEQLAQFLCPRKY